MRRVHLADLNREVKSASGRGDQRVGSVHFLLVLAGDRRFEHSEISDHPSDARAGGGEEIQPVGQGAPCVRHDHHDLRTSGGISGAPPRFLQARVRMRVIADHRAVEIGVPIDLGGVEKLLGRPTPMKTERLPPLRSRGGGDLVDSKRPPAAG